jgi:hypothetical protein
MAEREPYLVVVIGFKGVGKTYETKKQVESYIMNDPKTARKARPVLVFDVNGEYTDYQAIDFDITEKNDYIRSAELRKISAPGKYRIVNYKKDRSLMSVSEMYQTLITICKYYRGGLLILEDVNRYMLYNVKVDIVGLLIGLRHLGTDLIIHYQSLRRIPTQMWANMNYLRWHKQSDGIDKYKGKMDNYELFKIGELISQRQYMSDPRYFFYIDLLGDKLLGVDELVFEKACLEYLAIVPGALRDRQRLMKMDPDKEVKTNNNAVKAFIEDKKKQYL